MSKQGYSDLKEFASLCAPAGGATPTCGSARGEKFIDAAELSKADLCEVGTPMPATFQGSGPRYRKCKVGTASVDCSAEQQTNGGTDGVCGVAHAKSYTTAGAVNAAGLCEVGAAVPSTVNGN